MMARRNALSSCTFFKDRVKIVIFTYNIMNIYELFFTYVLPALYAITLIYLSAVSFKKHGVSFKSVGMLFLVFTHFFGYISLPFRVGAKVSSAEYMPYQYINDVSTLSFIGIVLFYVFSHTAAGRNKITFSDKYFIGSPKLFVRTTLFLSFVGMMAFYAINGISFNSDDYALKLGGNAGSGVIIMIMSSFVSAVIVYAITSDDKYVFVKSIIMSLLFGMAYYVLIGGSRNVMFSAMFIVALICHSRGLIGILKLICIGSACLILIGIMAIVRYSDVDISESGSLFGIIVRYLADSVSPINYQSIAVKYFSNDRNVGGIYYFFTQFSGFIPRFIWPDKPIVTMNSSYYFTVSALGLSNGLNMASTLLGSSLVIFGKYFFWCSYVISGVVFRFLDKIILMRRVGVIQIAALMTMPFSFFMARESLEFFLFIFLKNIITVSFVYFSYKAIYYILPKK